MRKASQVIYEDIRAKKLLPPKKFTVYSIIYFYGPISRHDVDIIYREKNPSYVSVRSKINELIKDGVVEINSQTVCPVTKRQVFLFDVTDTLPVDYAHKNKRTSLVRELEDRLILAEKVLTGCQNLVPLIRGGDHVGSELKNYFTKYPDKLVRMKTQSERGLNVNLAKSSIHQRSY